MGLVRRDDADRPDDAAPDPPLPDMLIQLLDDVDPNRRRESALRLGGAPEAVGALLDRVHVERDPVVLDAILNTLAAHDTEQVAAGLIGHLASDDADVRTAVAEALATMRQSMPPMLPQLLADPDPDVRILTATVMGGLNHPEALSWLAEMIRHDRHPNVVSAAIDALLPSVGAEHLALFHQARDRFPDDPFIRFVVEAAPPGTSSAP